MTANKRFIVLMCLMMTSRLFAESTAAGFKNAPEAQCDIPGGDLRGAARPDALACQELCRQESACKAYTFISGWNRCLLKTKVSRHVPVRFYSGHIDVSASGERQITGAEFDQDNSGKDMRKIPHTVSGEACGAACLADKKCLAFAYIGGYSDCWLKRNHGKVAPKIFYCGERF